MGAQAAVDGGNRGNGAGTTKSASTVAHIITSTGQSCISPQPGTSSSSRMETIQQSLAATGLSDKGAARVARGKLRTTSLKIYDSKWKLFAQWCDSQNPQIDPWEASVREISEFLYKLFMGGLQVRTIAGYRTAIASSLDLKGAKIGQSKILSKLIQSFYVDRPVRRNVFPQWDLSVVLRGLRSHPFERKKGEEVPLNLLTYKTVFLVTLASGARRGEIHALDYSKIRWSQDHNQVFLKPNPFFMAKTHRPDRPMTAFKGFSIKALPRSDGSSDPDRLLCPVRTLKFYLARTKSARRGRNTLFLPLKLKQTAIHSNTISSWIVRAIQTAYVAADKAPEYSQLLHVRAHEVRALASSWDALKQVSFSDIMAACRWRSHSTFSDYYLRDISCIEGELLALVDQPTPSMCTG